VNVRQGQPTQRSFPVGDESISRSRKNSLGKLDLSLSPAPHLERSPAGDKNSYATFFFSTFTRAHLARCAAAIFLRADADMVRFTGAEPVVFAVPTAGFDPLRAFDHLAFCARLISLRAEADRVRLGVVSPLRPSNLPKTARAASTCLS
jgi:hypothetical protein